jgi:hypothetical protein
VHCMPVELRNLITLKIVARAQLLSDSSLLLWRASDYRG